MKKILMFMMLGLLCTGSLTAQKKYYQAFADSEMKRFPQAWQLDYGSRPYFGYTQGLGCLAMLKVWEKTGDKKYYDYVAKYADFMINNEGVVHSFDHANQAHNIDMINAGKILFTMYKETKNEKYKKAMDILYNTMMTHPRTSEGGFWHKQRYPWQMWLDGLYMGDPYLAQYAATFDNPKLMDDAVNQFMLVKKHMYDPKTGLYYHAWDEKKEQKWCDPETGLSHIFWGRSIGWWFMALVDVLDFVPADHPQRPELIAMVQGLADALPKYQKDGLWYQVVDQAEREGNYPEASVTSMFMYSYAKAVNKGYIAKKYRKYAEDAFKGLTTKLMRKDADGTLNLLQCCAVAGLGGSPYRDGSYEYYINEKIRENDAKATGPFIMGCIELDK